MKREDFKNPTFPEFYWEEYVEDRYYPGAKEELAMIKNILDKNPEYHGLTGERLQEQYDHMLVGEEMDFTWRSWGALMAAYMNTKEGERKYNYMSFYM